MNPTADSAAWINILTSWHYQAAYFFAFLFPVIRWFRLKLIGKKIKLGIVIHQAATGFILPAFIFLILSYTFPSLIKDISPHEMGMAGLIALITSLREICVDGQDG